MNVCASRRDCMNRYVYSRRDCMNVCASRREHNSRNSIVMARHHTIRIIVPIRTLIRFWQFLINKITEFSDPDDKIIGKNYLPGCNQFGNFCMGENRFHDNRGGVMRSPSGPLCIVSDQRRFWRASDAQMYAGALWILSPLRTHTIWRVAMLQAMLRVMRV